MLLYQHGPACTPTCMHGRRPWPPHLGRQSRTLTVGLAQHLTIQHGAARGFAAVPSSQIMSRGALCVHNRLRRHTHTHTHTHTHRAHPVRLPWALRRSSGTDPIPHPCEIVVLYQKRHYHHRGLLYRSHCKPGLQSITISPGGVTSLSSLSSADHLCRI